MILTGIGYDTHRLVEGRRLVLGGVEIPHTLGLLGHSDADVLSHAIADALLGTIAAGDIGIHFPNTDASIEGISSLKILSRTVEILAASHAKPVHIDATLIAERPKISPHLPAIRATLAKAMGLPLERVSVKATTNEKMGFLGREEGISAMAVATVEQLPDPTFYPNI
ncbi:MAG: 2-C-methyl-D-erythritol 2,4-cyclodiphosphate synthase [Verrucomicrobia bacterium]|nr:2-C-methyl-D-erythritol 2,4-cyclodiphosphate synthase [Verrucomicrobiota bacterium]